MSHPTPANGAARPHEPPAAAGATDLAQDLLALALALARRPDDVRLVLELAGRRVEVRVGPVAAPLLGEGIAALTGGLSQMEADILEALGAGTLTGQQIAARAGYPYEASLRACLAALRRRGLLGGPPGSPGYAATAEGLALLARHPEAAGDA